MTKINRLEITNFQNHKHSIFDFNPGINIIAGNSGNGKSSVLRSLRLLFENKPSATEYIPLDAPKSTTLIKGEFTGFNLERERNAGTQNEYRLTLEGQDCTTFKKFGQSVPEEISTQLNLKEHNFQSQHSPYFLLQDSGSEVAEKLNGIAGLEIIDASFDKISELLNKEKTKIKLSEKQIDEYNARLEKLEGVDECIVLIDSIDECLEKQNEIFNNIKKLNAVIDNLENLEGEQERVQEVLNTKEDVEIINEYINKSLHSDNQYVKLQELIENIKNLEEKQNSIKDQTSAQEDIDFINDNIKQLVQVNKDIKNLGDVCENITKISAIEEDLNDWLEVRKEAHQLNTLIQEYINASGTHDEVVKLVNKIMQLEDASKDKEQEITDAEERKMNTINLLDVCYVCGHEIIL